MVSLRSGIRLGGALLLAFGVIVICYQLYVVQPCVVESFNRDECVEYHEHRYKRIMYNMKNSTIQGLVDCGAVLDCNTSPCYANDHITIGDHYYCGPWWFCPGMNPRSCYGYNYIAKTRDTFWLRIAGPIFLGLGFSMMVRPDNCMFRYPGNPPPSKSLDAVV